MTRCGLGRTQMATWLLRRGDRATCLQCPSPVTHSRSRRRPGPGPIPQAFPEEHRFATGTDGAQGARRQEAYPRSSPKDQMGPGRVDTGISALLSPRRNAWSHLIGTFLWQGQAVPGGWHSRTGPLGPWGPKCHGRIFPWPGWPALNTRPIVSTPGPHPQWVGPAGLTPRLRELLAWARARGQAPGPHGRTALPGTGVDLPGRRTKPEQARG